MHDHDTEIAQATQYCCELEQKYLKDRHEVDRQNLLAQRKVVRKLMNNRKSQFYQNKILSSKTIQNSSSERSKI